MRHPALFLAAAVLFATASFASAQTPTASPAPSAAPTKGHRQRKVTPEPADTPAATVAATPAPTVAHSPAPAPANPSPAKKTRAEKRAEKAEKAGEAPKEVLNATPAPGGGPGMVWVNTKTHVYHPESSHYYGRTKQGKYLSEADAVAEGDKPAKHAKKSASAQ